jgi:hypothetical protein
VNKQQRAKRVQGYTDTPRCCGNCAAREFQVETWPDHFDPSLIHSREHHQRCGFGGFAVKKTATCLQWRAKEQPK